MTASTDTCIRAIVPQVVYGQRELVVRDLGLVIALGEAAPFRPRG